ncbi:FAD-dependent oxidoreductase [Streptacidiphilus neutrinimicus]|uniref:FAD-dependent oxidoreductase n=1 Tax=Streptacidiphilus neutrinimicus TaxID=105420 RepID=UPI0005A61540|nr:NAD(P)/FAD-dependent oxidoreductase [Streptacidiphilus neutrinimicus]
MDTKTGKVRSALVVGGGIAGPVTAMALEQAGIKATIFEAYDGPAENVGGGMGLSPNGVQAFDAIGVGDAVRAVSTPTNGLVLHSWNGKTLARFGTLPGIDPTRFVMRAELFGALRRAAEERGIATVYGKRIVDASEDADGVTARFEDGTTATADVLIGADGLRSTVRRLIDPAAPSPQFAGTAGFGAMVTVTDVPATEGWMHMTFGKRCFFAWQVFPDGTGIWFINLPVPQPLSVNQQRELGAAYWLEHLRQMCADDNTPAARMLAATEPETMLFAGSAENMPLPTKTSRVIWSRGRMVLTGDAAHAPSSSSGQGASLAAESAVQLARCLRDLPLPQALARYEDLRRPRVERIIKETARTNSRKAAGPVARVIRDALLPTMFKLAKPESRAWQFRYPIDFDAPVA